MESPTYWLTRTLFQRGLAFIYFIGFLIVINQFCPLLGEKGLLPAPQFIRQIRFRNSPSIFFIQCSDFTLLLFGWIGLALSIVALSGQSEAYGQLLSGVIWFSLWLIYLSYVNIGQIFYGFGWETLLLETGFLAIFLGSKDIPPPTLVIWLIRWVLFRLMFGAGLIKLRGDPCWRDLTCMIYHYETQPLPNPLSRYFHALPAWMQKMSVLFTHFVEVLVPWAYFIPRTPGAIAGIFTIVFQTTLILSGNLSWLNCITIVLAFTCFDDAFLTFALSLLRLPTPLIPPSPLALSWLKTGVLSVLGSLIAYLSIGPIRNLFSPAQAMNASFEPLHLVNTYGAFGSVTKERNEIILLGTNDPDGKPEAKWLEIEFKGKPGNIDRIPSFITPYHYKLDWQMWFAAMSSYQNHPWILKLIGKLLKGEKPIMNLMAPSPFQEAPPKWIRADLYRYRFTSLGEAENHWWQREYLGVYLPPLSLDHPGLQSFLNHED